MIYTAAQYYDQANSQTIPDWATLDLGLRYKTILQDRPVTWQANILNVTGNNYWATTVAGSSRLGHRGPFSSRPAWISDHQVRLTACPKPDLAPSAKGRRESHAQNRPEQCGPRRQAQTAAACPAAAVCVV